MDHIRGEKVLFGKDDYHHLDAMPSCLHDDAVVLAVPPRRSWTKRCVKLVASLVLLAVICNGLLFIALEEGYLDDVLTARAEATLSAALGDEFKPEVGAVRLRFSPSWMLALVAQDVKITHVKSGLVALRTDSIATMLDPLGLLAGHLVVTRAEIGRAEGDLRFLPPAAAIDWATMRIDRVPQWLNAIYPALDRGLGAMQKSSTERVSFGTIALRLPQATKLGDTVELSDLDLSEQGDGRVGMTTTIHYGKLNPKLSVSLDATDGKTEAVAIDLSDVAAEPLLLKYSVITGERRYGPDLPLDLHLRAKRAGSLTLSVNAGKGLFYADGETQAINGAKLLLDYDFKDRKIEIADALIDAGETMLPISGAAIDLDRVRVGKPPGFAFSIVSKDAIANTEDSAEVPEPFDMSANGYFLPRTKELMVDSMGVATKEGALGGSLYARFVKPSPAVTFAGRVETLSMRSVKQLWPFWFGKKARHWVQTHMRDGMIRNGEIDVSLAAGRIPEHPTPLLFENNELHIAFDADNTSVLFLDQAPRSVKTSGHFLMTDRNVKIDIKSGSIPLPSGKVVSGRDGVFTIGDTALKPTMASLQIKAMGDASAVAEFAGFEPINAMSRAPFAAKDLSGTVEANIKASFGLDRAQDPPKPEWTIGLKLDNVGLKQPFENRKISDLNGTLAIDTKNAVLTGKADIDGMNFDVSLTEPLDRTRKSERKWQVEGIVAQGELAKVAPALLPYVDGEIGVTIGNGEEGAQKAKLDLTSTSLSVPVIGWRKGVGIPATASFSFAGKHGETRIDDLVFDGDGFGAKGEIRLDSKGLASAKFSRVKLSTADNFALSMRRKSGGFAIDVNGASIDMRPFLDQAKSPSTDTAVNDTKFSDTITAKLDSAIGHNNENLSAVTLNLLTSKSTISRLSFSAVTRSGQALVINKDESAGVIEVTGGDAGQIARFADVYKNMYGGLLNIKLKQRNANSWRGSVDIRNFALVNDERLKSIVSASTDGDGRSRSEALKADIDVNSQKFSRGFARILVDGKLVRVENGIARGNEVGATFQGTLRDNTGQMDMTGTFMPAYGINRLFSELPIIGTILGNGRDRGLLGITFKLVGVVDRPKLSVNPLSMIAPGVFRNIFEFE